MLGSGWCLMESRVMQECDHCGFWVNEMQPYDIIGHREESSICSVLGSV